jgi:hypothetical protein
LSQPSAVPSPVPATVTPGGPPPAAAASSQPHPLTISITWATRSQEEKRTAYAQDIHRLDELFSRLGTNLVELPSEAVAAFEQMVHTFLRKYENCESFIPGLSTVIQTIRGNRDTILYFALINKGIIINTPDRGNCFFHAAGEALEKLGIRDAFPLHDHVALRAKVVVWMRERLNTGRLAEYINNSVETFLKDTQRRFNSDRKGWIKLRDEEGLDVREALAATDREEAAFLHEYRNLEHPVLRFEEYLSRMDQIGFFAGEAEFYAIAEMYKVSVHVEVEYEGRPPQYNRTFGAQYADPDRSITIIHVNGKHFKYRLPHRLS